MSKTIRLLLADDHTIIREALTALLSNQADMSVVAEAANGQEAIDLFRLHQPCVTLMDLSMPRMDGIEAIQRIRQEFPYACILLMTVYADEVEIAHARRTGAVACLLKDIPTQELFAAIRAASACSSTDSHSLPPASA